MMVNNLLTKEAPPTTAVAAAPPDTSSTPRANAGSTTRSATAAGTSSSSSQRSQPRSQYSQQRQPHLHRSGSGASSVSSNSTTTTTRSANHHNRHDAPNDHDKRRAATRTHTTPSSSSSSTISAAAAARALRRQDDRSHSSTTTTIREDAIAPTNDVGPEKFAAKVRAQSSQSSSSPHSDKTSSPLPLTVVAAAAMPSHHTSKSTHSSSAGSVAASCHSNNSSNSNSSSGHSASTSTSNNSSTSKPSRMIVKRRTLGSSSHATVATTTAIPNKYVRQQSPPPFSSSSSHSIKSDTLQSPPSPRTLARKVIQPSAPPPADDDSSSSIRSDAVATAAPTASKPRPIRIKYATPTRGTGSLNGKREISHASLGKLIARLTDAHQYDTQFRDVFLLTYRCFCSPYDFIKKLMKRYAAVLTLCSDTLDAATLYETQRVLDQIAEEDEDDTDRSSTATSISTAKSDINTGMEANVSIMRLLSVLKYWIKESQFIESDLQNDRRSQKKLMAFLADIQTTSPVPSIRQHAENMLLLVASLVRSQQASQLHHHTAPVGLFHASSASAASSNSASSQLQPPAMSSSSSNVAPPPPPPPALVASTSVSSIHTTTTDSISGTKPRVVDERSTEVLTTSSSTTRGLTAAMSKLKLTRSSSDPKRERSNGNGIKFKFQQQQQTTDSVATDVFHLRTRTNDDATKQLSASAPKFSRGITTGSADSFGFGGSSSSVSAAAAANDISGDAFTDSMYRSRILVPRNSSRTSYDNVKPLTGLTAQELADQLTLVEAEYYFAQVNPRELTNKAWTRESKHRDAPHVMALIELFDATAEWVSSEILHPRLQAAERAKLLTFFIDAAENCYQMNNFNTLFAIFTGLSAPCVRQLSTTWSLVSASASDKYQLLQGICSPEDNYRNYRQQFGFAEGQPRLPCWFILVKDLFQFEESMKSTEDGLIHWQKFCRIHRVVSEALDRQNVSYLPASGAVASTAHGISRKGKGLLRHDRRVQNYIRQRLETVRKDSSVLYQLARNANTQESILFVNSLSEAGFL